MRQVSRSLTLIAFALSLASCAGLSGGPKALPPHSRYVAMGSSFAAGPGIAPGADQPPNRCARSANNYAHLLARSANLDLTDVSCSGATTEHLLGPWRELPPQLDAVTSGTALVTITIGGNDVGYVGHLMAASCRDGAGSRLWDRIIALCRGLAAQRGAGGPTAGAGAIEQPDAAAWGRLASNLRGIDAEILRRAPKARIVHVLYVTALPDGEPCPQTPLSARSVAAIKAIAATLATTTGKVAHQDHVEVLDAGALSKGHDACARDAWSNGLLPRDGVPPSAPYHPNEKAMQAISAALLALLTRS